MRVILIFIGLGLPAGGLIAFVTLALHFKSTQIEAQGLQLSAHSNTIATQQLQLSEHSNTIAAQELQLSEQSNMIAAQQLQLSEHSNTIASQELQLSEQSNTIAAQELQLSEWQTRIFDMQTELIEAQRRTGISSRIWDLGEAIRHEILEGAERQGPNDGYRLSEPLCAEVISLSRALRPYRYKETPPTILPFPQEGHHRTESQAPHDGLTLRPHSLERGDLLLLLINMEVDLSQLLPNVGQSVVFHFADLRRANLYRCHLSRLKLQNADLREANLNYAVLSQCHLEDANLTGAKLNGADCTGMHCWGASFAEIKSWGADFRNSNMGWTDFRGAWLGAARFDQTQLPDPEMFAGADLTEADFDGAIVSNKYGLDWLDKLAEMGVTGFERNSWKVVTETIRGPYGGQFGLEGYVIRRVVEVEDGDQTSDIEPAQEDAQ